MAFTVLDVHAGGVNLVVERKSSLEGTPHWSALTTRFVARTNTLMNER